MHSQLYKHPINGDVGKQTAKTGDNEFQQLIAEIFIFQQQHDARHVDIDGLVHRTPLDNSNAS
jgi:hypothetical protein